MPPAYCDLIFRVSLHTNKKCYKPQKRFIAFWSEWRDSNSRHPGPKNLWELFSNNFCSFLTPFIPEKLLFETLVSAVSVCSKPGYGQICDQNRFPQKREAVFSYLCIGIPVGGSIIVSGKQLLAVFLHYGSVECGIIHNIIFVFEKSPPDLPLHFVCNLR